MVLSCVVKSCFAAKRDSEPAHYKNRNADRLKDGALLIFRPAAQATPDRGQDACETRQAAENPVGKSDTGVGQCPR
jgi:hypothetical protein